MRFLLLLVFLAPLVMSGCASEPQTMTEPPEGWQADDLRWWRAGVDTSRAFRPMETFDDMGVPHSNERIIVSGRNQITRTMLEAQMMNRVKDEFIELYRNNPEVVDSLYLAFIGPIIEKETITDANFIDKRDDIKRRGYRVISRRFRAPQDVSVLGQDVPVVIPDSLAANGVSGTVRIQVYLNAEGTPQAVRVLDGVHPLLDRILLNAVTRMEFLPAYLDGEPVDGWMRMRFPYNRNAGA